MANEETQSPFDLEWVQNQLRSKGVSDHVIGEEADDLVRYGSDLPGVLEKSIPHYLERSQTQQTGQGSDSMGGPVKSQQPMQQSSQPQGVAQQWNQPNPQRDALYNQLLERANQRPAVDRFDPIIRGQADAYAANEQRSQRNYLSNVAERAGPLANIRGEERMAAERTGQRTGTFEAELIGRELGARRDEIAQALSSMQGLLTSEQQMSLTYELAALNRQIQQQQLDLQSKGQNLGYDQFLRELALREWESGNNDYYRRSGI